MFGRKFGPNVHRYEVVVENPTSQSAKTFGFENGSGKVRLGIRRTQHGYALAAT
jgi:hypothetical protein